MSNVNVNLTLENIRTITVMFLDIFIMWIVLYYAIRIVRSNSKTVQIFKGILLIVIIDAIAKFLGLKTLAYLTDIFMNWGFLAVIIIFQPELRSLLEKLGKTNVFSRITTLTGNEKENLVDQIVTAAMLLSKDRTGALITIEQSHSLDDFIATGTKLNSDVTAELLTSIFVTSTPLHDGAVIIQGDKIACASAYFPPTNLDLPNRYGARHRAAIGISEITDAVTVVVSEETGQISITQEGKIYNVNKKQLRDYLLRVICGEETEVRSNGRKLSDEPAREVIIDDEKAQVPKEEKKDAAREGATGVLKVLAIKKQEEKKPEKIAVESVVPAENTKEDERMQALEEEASEIKLPHKKERPVPSYPENEAARRREQEQEEKARQQLAKVEDEKKREAEEAAARRAEEERKKQEAAEAEEKHKKEEAEKAKEQMEAFARAKKEEEQRRKKQEEEKQKKAAEATHAAIVEEEKDVQAAPRMTSEQVKAAREAAMRRLSTQPENNASKPLSGKQPKVDEKKFDTTKLDISQLMGMNDDLDQTFSLIDGIPDEDTSDQKKGGAA